MPIYEFTCRSCGKTFDELLSAGSTAKPPCPACGGKDTRRNLTSFATGGGSKPGPAGPSDCGPSRGRIG